TLCKGCAAGQIEISFTTDHLTSHPPSAAELYRTALEERDGGDHKGKGKAVDTKRPTTPAERNERLQKLMDEEDERRTIVTRLFEMAIENFETELNLPQPVSDSKIPPTTTLPGPLATRLLYASCLTDMGNYVPLPNYIDRAVSVFESCEAEAEQRLQESGDGSSLAAAHIGKGRALLVKLNLGAREEAAQIPEDYDSDDEDGSEDEDEETDEDLEAREVAEEEALKSAYNEILQGLHALNPLHAEGGDGKEGKEDKAGSSTNGTAANGGRSTEAMAANGTNANAERCARDCVKLANLFYDFARAQTTRKKCRRSPYLYRVSLIYTRKLLTLARRHHAPTSNTHKVLSLLATVLYDLAKYNSQRITNKNEKKMKAETLKLLRESDEVMRVAVVSAKMEIGGVEGGELVEMLFVGARTNILLTDFETDDDLVLQAWETAWDALKEALKIQPNNKEIRKQLSHINEIMGASDDEDEDAELDEEIDSDDAELDSDDGELDQGEPAEAAEDEEEEDSSDDVEMSDEGEGEEESSIIEYTDSGETDSELEEEARDVVTSISAILEEFIPRTEEESGKFERVKKIVGKMVKELDEEEEEDGSGEEDIGSSDEANEEVGKEELIELVAWLHDLGFVKEAGNVFGLFFAGPG
ncbi:hypothetical protein HK097_005579, partial [Rhizophlyctis rosea]